MVEIGVLGLNLITEVTIELPDQDKLQLKLTTYVNGYQDFLIWFDIMRIGFDDRINRRTSAKNVVDKNYWNKILLKVFWYVNRANLMQNSYKIFK